jgi:hypothetical protein
MGSGTRLVEDACSKSKQDENWMASIGCSPSHDTVRVDNKGKMRRTPMAKDCLYCGLRFSDTTHFCPNCGRPTESGFIIRPIQESELERLCREVKEKDDLIRQLLLTRTRRILGDNSESRGQASTRATHVVNEQRGGNI